MTTDQPSPSPKSRPLKWLATLAVLGAILIFSTGSHAMGKMYLFSEVRGTVTHKGQPVQGAQLEREYRWAWKNEVGKDAAVTDAKGQFSFPSVVRSSFLGSFLPHEPMVQQTILIQHQGQTYKAWMYDRGNYQDLGELKGKPIVLKCDLDAPLSHKSGIYGICEIV